MNKQTRIKGLPVFAAELDEECGITRVSLVDYPAVERDFLAFNTEKTLQQYSIKDEDKRLVFGVLMRANFPIYRKDSRLGEYFILYKPETLRAMAEKYLTEGRANNVDLMHDGVDVDGVNMVQIFIKDSTKGIIPAGFEDVEDGSLFGEFHVTNDDIWQGVKDGTFKGFSIETLNIITPETGVISTEKVDPRLLDALSKFLSENNMTEKFNNALKAFMEAIGAKSETAEEQKFGAVTTDKAVVHWEGDEDLKEGDAVFAENEEGERTPLEDGDYTTEDGKVIKVVDGKVSEIVDDAAEVEENDKEEVKEETKAEKMQRIIDAFAMSYSERYRKIYEAIRTLGFDGYIAEASDDFAVLSVWDGETEKYMKFKIAWTGDEATASDPKEVFPTFVTDADLKKLEEGKAEVEAMKAELKALREKPTAQPAHEEFKNTEMPKTGDERYDRLRAFGAALMK